MTGLEFVAGYLVAWALRKARRVGKRADKEVDRVLDSGMDRLHDLVSQKLGADPALARLELEAAEGGQVSERTHQRVELAVEEAAEHDPQFAADLTALIEQLQAAQAQLGVSVGDHGLAAGGDVNIRASGQGVAAGVIHGQVSTDGNPHQPGPAGR